MTQDEHAGPARRPLGTLIPRNTSIEDDRRRASEDRRRAAEFLSQAYRDDMTGALSRRPGREQMQTHIDHAHRDSSPLTFVFIDVDGLKQVNDVHGHLSGDELLAAVGTALRTSLRSYDLIVRYGGDEFVCALPGGTAGTAAASILRVQATLDQLIPGATVSAGHAELRPGEALDEVLHRADTELYQQRTTKMRPRRRALALVPVASIACGDCGSRIGLDEFVLALTSRMSRTADCARCGATTEISVKRD